MITQKKVEIYVPKTDIIVDIAIKCPDCNKMFPARLNFQTLSQRVEYVRCKNCSLPILVNFNGVDFIVSSMYNKEFDFNLIFCQQHNRKAIITKEDVSYCDICISEKQLDFKIYDRIVLICNTEKLYSIPIKFSELNEYQFFIFYDEAWNNFTYSLRKFINFSMIEVYYLGKCIDKLRLDV